MDYYNEFDSESANWLRDLIKAKLIPEGEVDERSITEIKPNELQGFNRCHFFAGIGGWPLALRLSGVPDSKPLWTGSCPCQPYSVAGKHQAQEDPRHLWPTFYGLIRECKPPVLFGEQVAAAIGFGWLDDVQSDLEREGYAVGKAVLSAASIGAPHIRQRLYFVADSTFGRDGTRLGKPRQSTGEEKSSGGYGLPNELADSDRVGRECQPVERCTGFSELGNNNNTGLEGRSLFSGNERSEFSARETGSSEFLADAKSGSRGLSVWEGPQYEVPKPGRRGEVGGFWGSADWVYCRDEKFRPVESFAFPLAYGIPRSMGKMPRELQILAEMAGLSTQQLNFARKYRKSSLRGYGNAIVPQVAAEFIKAYWESR